MKLSSDDKRCYIHWLNLKRSPEYQHISRDIRELIQQELEAERRFAEADAAYRRFFPENPRPGFSNPTGSEFQEAVRAYTIAERTYSISVQELEKAKKRAAQEFGLFMWWDPDDPTINFENAGCIVGPNPVVYVVEPADKDRDRENPFVDKSGWLTVRVNIKAPVEESETLFGTLLRLNRTPSRKRERPDKDRLPLEVFARYQDTPNFRPWPSNSTGRLQRSNCNTCGVAS